MILKPKNITRMGEAYRPTLGPLPDREDVAELSAAWYEYFTSSRRPTPKPVLKESRLTGRDTKRLLKCVARHVTAETLEDETPTLARRHMGAGANGAAVAIAPCHPGRRGTRAPALVAERWVVVKGGGKDGTEPLSSPMEAEDSMAITKAAKGKTPHVVHTMGVVQSEVEGKGWTVSELLRPMLKPTRVHLPVSTLRGLLADLSFAGYARVLETVFQTLWTLAALQSALPGFIHQDLNEDNIMLTPGDGRPHTYTLVARRSGKQLSFRLPSAAGSVKFIDFEFASWSGVPRHVRKLRPYAKLGMDARPKPARDLALFIFVLRTTMQRVDAPRWAPLFSRFAEDVIPAKLQTSKLRTDYDSPTPNANTKIHAPRSGVLSPAQALKHDIFAPLRTRTAGRRPDFRITA